MKIWTYRYPVTVDGQNFKLVFEAGFTGSCLRLQHQGAWLEDRQVFKEGYRLHRISVPCEQGELVFELGPRSAWAYGVQVRRGQEVLYRSHPEPFAYLAATQSMISRSQGKQSGEDFSRLKANAPAIAVDIALGLLFFALGKLTDLRTAALVTAAVGLSLLPIQWAINRWSPRKLDLLGGMALFGVVMMLLSAGFSWYFDSEFAVQLKATVIGGIGAACFGLDALLGKGRWLGERMKTYMVYEDINARRLAAGMSAVGGCLAGVNLAVASLLSKDAWLWYTLWGDVLLVLVLANMAIRWSRRQPRPATFPA